MMTSVFFKINKKFSHSPFKKAFVALCRNRKRPELKSCQTGKFFFPFFFFFLLFLYFIFYYSYHYNNCLSRKRWVIFLQFTMEVRVMHQSIPAAPRHPGHKHFFFFALDGKFPEVGTLELSNPPGWGRKKRANALSSVNTATFIIDRTVEWCRFKHFNVRFFVSINVFLCNSARILIKRPWL